MTVTIPRGLPLRLLSIGLLIAAFVRPTPAQDIEVPSTTTTYALDDVQVVQAPGQVLDSATVVIRDGVIEAVGSGVDVPYDARSIDGDSLVVYAGFIDGLSHAGVETPESDEEEDAEDPSNPPRDVAGIQPDRSVASMLTPDDSNLDELRKAGFTAGHVVPEGQMLPGAGAHVLYGGETGDDMLLETDQTRFAQIKGSGNFVYPSTDMAVIAQLRQLYREADRRQTLEADYEQNPTGQPLPPRDPAHDAFFPVLDGDVPIAFYADEAVDIHRVLALQEELAFPLVLAGLQDGFRTVEALQETNAPLFLTLDLPDEPESAAPEDTTIADTTEAPNEYYDRTFRTASYEDVPEEAENLQLRHALEYQKYLEGAATLHEADLPFGFTTREVNGGDVREHLRLLIEHGLPSETALSALTTHPAAVLDLDDRLGTVEEGKMANLVVANGPYFDEDTDVKYVFVNGRQYDYTTDAGSGEVSGEVSKVLGTWSFTLETPGGEVSGTITIEGDESGLGGSVTTQGESQDIQSVSFDGSRLSFRVPSSEGPAFSVSVTVKGDTFEGTATAQGQSLPISGTRTSGPEWR